MDNVALIPARGGSKRIKKKNIKLFNGKPIIGWVIEAIKASKCFSKIIVSTDCKETASVSETFGAEIPFLRPKNISDDFSGLIPVVRHAIEFFNEKKVTLKTIAMIYPTAPFLSPRDLKAGISLMHGTDFVVSVTSFNYPIQRALVLTDNDKYVTMDKKEYYQTRSQDLDTMYHDAAHFVIGKNAAWKEKVPFISGRTRPIFIPRIRVQDIDEEEDWKEAELRFNMLKDNLGSNKKFL